MRDDDIFAALTQDGLSSGRPADIAFVRAALVGKMWPKGIDLRRDRDRFDEILSTKGAADPIGAAQNIVSALFSRIAARKSRDRAIGAGIEWVVLVPNNKLAGPCPACLSAAKSPIPISQAPLGPLPGCPHPSECATRFRSHLFLD